MNSKIRKLKYEELLFVDIETVRGSEEFDENHPFYDVWAWKQRNKENNEIPSVEEVVQSYYNKAALFAEWGKIVCVSVGYIHNEKLYITSFTGEEEEILVSYVNMLKKQSRMLVFHNGISFDVPYLRKRWFINGLGEYITDKQGNDVYMKPWLLDDVILDSMVAWKGSGFMNTSMDELAMCLGIPSSKNEMKGNEVSDYFYNGKIDDIRKYCEKDVEVLANIIRKWKGDDIIQAEFKETITLKETPILERIYTSKEISEKDKEDLRKLVLVKKPTEEEIEVVRDIVTNIYIESKMFKADSKAVVKEKENEVNELIEELCKKK